MVEGFIPVFCDQRGFKDVDFQYKFISMIQENQNIPWNKGKLIGQKLPLKLKEIWSIRIRLQMDKNIRELALFNLNN